MVTWSSVPLLPGRNTMPPQAPGPLSVTGETVVPMKFSEIVKPET